jgi:hypothetical protein
MNITLDQIDLLARFVMSLKDHYGAVEVKNDKGHRQFINPWNLMPGDPGYIFILKDSGRVKYGKGTGATQSTFMSDRMVQSIASRRQLKPSQFRAPSGSPIAGS